LIRAWPRKRPTPTVCVSSGPTPSLGLDTENAGSLGPECECLASRWIGPSFMGRRSTKLSLCWLLAVIGVVFAFPAQSRLSDLQNRYFLVVWGYQGAGNPPRESHTFLTVYRGDDLAEGRVAPATISWFPADGVIHLVGVEWGRNISLGQTLAIACQGRKHVVAWGPYEISSSLYQRALARIKLLQSGRINFSALGLRPGSMNCIKAAGDITNKPFHAPMSWGHQASRAVVRHLSPFFKDGGRINRSVARMVLRSGCKSDVKP
jgi:hypothetical protein